MAKFSTSKNLLDKILELKRIRPGKYTPEDAGSFVGPVKTEVKERYPYKPYSEGAGPAETYWNRNGKHQDLNDEIESAMRAGNFERTAPWAHSYYRYYNDGDMPASVKGWKWDGSYYSYPYGNKYTARQYEYNPRTRTLDKTEYSGLTGRGEQQLENNADASILNEYQQYAKQMINKMLEEGKSPEEIMQYFQK